MKPIPSSQIPAGLRPYFQEYDTSQLDLMRDTNLVIQRTLEFGTWDELRWLFSVYSAQRIRIFPREHGERWLKPVTFHYWRKLLNLREWKKHPFADIAWELWPY